MKWHYRILVLLSLGTMMTHCGIPQPILDTERSKLIKPGECQRSETTSCLSGQIAVAPDIYVENQKFFDANDLAQRFEVLLSFINSDDAQRIKEGQYELKLLTNISNNSFAEEFLIYLKGPESKILDTYHNGKFQAHDLKPGVYKLRAQRDIAFRVSRHRLDQPTSDQPGGEDSQTSGWVSEQELTAKVFCGTLFSEQSLELMAGQAHQELTLDHFKLNITDKSCQTYEGNHRLNL